MKQLLPFFLAFIFIACSPSSNSNNSQQDSTATSTSTSIETTADAQSNTASSPDLQNEATFNALLATRINRDPEQSLPANDAEQQCVTQYDQNLLQKTNETPFVTRYSSQIQRILQKVGITSELGVRVITDFRNTSFKVRGGVSGHQIMILDGKLLDVLFDYANYLSLLEHDLEFHDPAIILDRIVAHHMNPQLMGVSQPSFYSLEGAADAVIDLAQVQFDILLGSLIFHEFGHYYLLHALQRCRNELAEASSFLHTSMSEDDADIISGILAHKAAHSLELTQTLHDILSFATIFPQIRSILDIATDSAQFGDGASNHSPLQQRKELIRQGFELTQL